MPRKKQIADYEPVAQTDKAQLSDQEVKTDGLSYNPGDAERAVIQNTFQAFTELKTMRDQPFRLFNDRTLYQVISDAQQRFNLYLRPRESPEEWQTQYVGGTIRNKTVAIMARLSARRIKRFFFGEDNDDKWRARICKLLDEKVAVASNAHMRQFFTLLAATVKGTVVKYHGYYAPWVEYYDIDGLDMSNPAEPKTKYTIKKRRAKQEVFTEIVPLEDFFPGDLRKLKPTEMSRCGRQRYLQWDEFQTLYGKYKNAKYVLPGAEAREHSFYKDFLPANIENKQVWVFELYKKPSASPDQMVITSNGVLLTPLISPLPFNHKMADLGIPFTAHQFEPYAEDFFYGMPLPFKLKGDSDVSDAIWRMAIDILYLALNPPVLSADAEEIESKEIGPGIIYKVQDPNLTREMRLDGPNDKAALYLRMLANNMNLASLDNVNQGASGTANPTATEIEAATEGALQLLTLFQNLVEWEAADEGIMQMHNILQFYPMPIDYKDGKPVFRTIRVDNIPKVLDGRMGSVKLHFVASKADLPSAPTVTPEQRARLSETYGEKFDEIRIKTDEINPEIEDVWITAEFMKDFAVGCRVEPNSSVKQSERQNKIDEVDWQSFVLAHYPDLVDRRKLLKQAGEAWGKNADEIIMEEAQKSQGPPIPSGMQGLENGLPALKNETLPNPIAEAAQRFTLPSRRGGG